MLKECKNGERFAGTVLVNEWKEVPFRQKPGAFLALTCQDRSGVLQGKMWEYPPQVLGWLKEGHDIFNIRGVVSEYRGALDLSIDEIQLIPKEEIDLTTLLPSSPVSENELESRLQSLQTKIHNPFLQALLNHFLEHPQWGQAYRQAPAAVKIHQAYLRGLWEHSVRVAELADGIGGHFPSIDQDLIITGALLHDVGKIGEYSYDRGIKFTTEGRLLGHIILGLELISAEISKIPEFPQELRSKILHIVSSHHGKYEWQSPKRPKIMEALVIHYADIMDAELYQFEQARNDHPGDEWSPYIHSMERYLYLK